MTNSDAVKRVERYLLANPNGTFYESTWPLHMVDLRTILSALEASQRENDRLRSVLERIATDRSITLDIAQDVADQALKGQTND